MINLKFAADLDALFESAAEELFAAWKNPFDAPIIIFPEEKVKQWFRLRLLSSHKVEALANLNSVSMDSFLWQTLKPAGNERMLSAEVLQNVIEAWLVLKEDKGIKNWQMLGEDVKNFIRISEEESDTEDAAKLFDFSLTMAGLFLDYEVSRPAGFLNVGDAKIKPEGILAYWKMGNLRNFFSDDPSSKVHAKEEWQKTLYSKIFHADADGKSVLARAFEMSGTGISYLTLPYLYSRNKANLAELKGRDIFFFGLSGQGQFYRVLIQEIAKYANLHAYIQNPCAEFWEDVGTVAHKWKWKKADAPDKISLPKNDSDDVETGLSDENDLLRNWGRTGRENIRLWCLASDYDFDYQGATGQSEKSLLGMIQNLVQHRQNSCAEGLPSKEDPSLTVLASPTKIREVEALHTKVCKLLESGARLDEMMVLSPSLDDYHMAIEEVFHHVPYSDPSYIPYTILDSSEKDSFTSKAAEILLQIRRKKGLDRPSFFELVKNPVVQSVRGISPEEVVSWAEWVSDLNVYRNVQEMLPYNWSFGVKRMLLARWMDKPYLTESGVAYYPYENMDSRNDAALEKFVQAVDSLDAWSKLPSELSIADVDGVKSVFNEWLNGDEDPLEKKVCKNLLSSLNTIQFEFYAGRQKMPFDELSFALSFAMQGVKTGNGRLFTGGLSFMKLAANRSLPVKYVFMLGMGAKDFPGRNSENSFDLRLSSPRWPGDDRVIDKNRYAFLCEFMSAKRELHISYVNRDLQKDEELVPSGVVRDLMNFVRKVKPDFKEDSIALDETRNLSELYTRRSLRNKKTTLMENDFVFAKKPNSEFQKSLHEVPEKIYGWQLKKFLENPFEFQVNFSMHLPEEAEDETIKPFEPIEVDALQKHSLSSALFESSVLQNENADDFIKSGLMAAEAKGDIPNGFFKIGVEQALKSRYENQLSQLDSLSLNKSEIKGKLPLQYFYSQKNGVSTLFAETDFYLKDSESAYHLFTVCSGKAGFRHFLNSFVCSLIIAANSTEVAVNFCLYVIPGVGEGKKIGRYSLTPEMAKDRLNLIIGKCFQERYAKLLPVDFVLNSKVKDLNGAKVKGMKDIPSNLNDLIEDYWPYPFAARDFFNEDDFGFGGVDFFKENLQKERASMISIMRELFEEGSSEALE